MTKPPEVEPVSALMQVLGEHWVLTLALADRVASGNSSDHSPYPTPLFFALASPNTIGRHEAPLLIFASDPSSHHGQLAGAGPTPAAAAVYLETASVGQLRGAQLRGSVVREDRWTPVGAAGLRKCYLARHPIAEPMLAAGRHQLYALVVSWAKVTDNRLGFGTHPVARFDGTCGEVEQSRP